MATKNEGRASERQSVVERARLYGFLGVLFFAPPSADRTRVLARMALTLGIACPGGLSVGEIEREFMDLFVVPNPRYVAPYESVYRDRWLLDPMSGTGPGETRAPLVMERLLMGESTIAVQQAYLQAGVLPEADLPDHLANELRFLAHLCTREAEAPAHEAVTWAQRRASFRRDHLLQWIAPLRETVAEKERLGYYGAALQLAEAVLQYDIE